jgi:hypothetical protein
VINGNDGIWQNALPTCTTSPQTLPDCIGEAWKYAINSHATRLTSVPSAVAFSPIFNNTQVPLNIVDDTYVTHDLDDRVWAMTTNLQPCWGARSSSLGCTTIKLGSTAQMIDNALLDGASVGFQSAGNSIMTTCADFKGAIQSGLLYEMRFFETSPALMALWQTCGATANDPPQPTALQVTFKSRFGG